MALSLYPSIVYNTVVLVRAAGIIDFAFTASANCFVYATRRSEQLSGTWHLLTTATARPPVNGPNFLLRDRSWTSNSGAPYYSRFEVVYLRSFVDALALHSYALRSPPVYAVPPHDSGRPTCFHRHRSLRALFKKPAESRDFHGTLCSVDVEWSRFASSGPAWVWTGMQQLNFGAFGTPLSSHHRRPAFVRERPAGLAPSASSRAETASLFVGFKRQKSAGRRGVVQRGDRPSSRAG